MTQKSIERVLKGYWMLLSWIGSSAVGCGTVSQEEKFQGLFLVECFKF
jgi:hypothetical protein